MSDEQTKVEPEEHDNETSQASESEPPDNIFIVPYPKVVFLYPTLLVTLVAALWMTVLENTGETIVDGEGVPSSTCVAIGTLFLVTFALNLVVLTVDFPRATSLTLFFVGVAVVLAIVLLYQLRPETIPYLKGLFARIRPLANATFYWVLGIIMSVIFAVVKIKIQFDYWEVRRNEILHHHGVLSDLRRYPTAGLQVEKEINDVFEYVLMRSGRLILKPAGEKRAFVLDNVPSINSREAQLTQMLSAIRVKVHSGD
jgi:hypothetical protein